MTTLCSTGYFDPPEQQPFRQLGWSDVDLDSSRALALKAAEMGIVLLMNDGILPATPEDFPNVVAVGPWGNQTTVCVVYPESPCKLTRFPLSIQMLQVCCNTVHIVSAAHSNDH